MVKCETSSVWETRDNIPNMRKNEMSLVLIKKKEEEENCTNAANIVWEWRLSNKSFF